MHLAALARLIPNNVETNLQVSSFDRLIDHIYEAAVLPELWADVLAEIAARCDGLGTVLFTQCNDIIRWKSSISLASLMKEFVSDWTNRNRRTERVLARNHAGFLRDLDVFTIDEINNDDMYTNFLRPNGLGWGAATVIPIPTGDFLVFSMERRFERGPVERRFVDELDLLRPHLARSAMISARMQLERAHAATETLKAIGLPAAVLTRAGRAISINDLLQKCSQIVIGARDKIGLLDAATNSLFAEALAQIESPAATISVRSLPLRPVDGRPPAICHLVPIKGAAHDLFSGAAAILIVTPLVASHPNAELLTGLFDLTPSELNVVRQIGIGETIENM